MGEIPIRDIKPLVEIPDYSFDILIALSLIILIILFITIYKIVLHFKNKKVSFEKICYLALKELSFENPKEFAYGVTKYGRVLAKEQRQKEIYNQLLDKLSEYKYKKSVNQLHDDVKNYYNLFMDMIHHEYK